MALSNRIKISWWFVKWAIKYWVLIHVFFDKSVPFGNTSGCLIQAKQAWKG